MIVWSQHTLLTGNEFLDRFADILQAEAGAEGLLPYDKVMECAARAAGVE